MKWFQVVLLCITNNSIKHQSLVYTQLNNQTVLPWPIVKTLLGATTPGQRAPASDGNEGVLRIPQSSHTGVSL